MKTDGLCLAVNVGNTSTGLGLYEGGVRVAAWRLGTARERTADEYAVLLTSLFAAAGRSATGLEGVAVASVVPPLVPLWRDLSRALCGRDAYVYGQDGPLAIDVRLDMDASHVGADRLCNAVGAKLLVGAPAIVVDIGTATTLDVVDRSGAFIGGAIAPGPATAAEGLYARAAKLPRVELRTPALAIGDDTVSAMQSGMIFGLAGAVDRLVSDTRRELGADNVPAIVTGGLATLLGGLARTIDRVEPWLTLEGLRHAAAQRAE